MIFKRIRSILIWLLVFILTVPITSLFAQPELIRRAANNEETVQMAKKVLQQAKDLINGRTESPDLRMKMAEKFLASSLSFLNEVYPEKRIGLHDLFNLIRMSNLSGEYGTSIQILMIVMYTSFGLKSDALNMYRKALAADIETNGLKGLESLALNAMDYEIFGSGSDVTKAVKKKIMPSFSALNKESPVIVYDIPWSRFLSFKGSFVDLIFQEMISLSEPGPGPRTRGLMGAIDKAACIAVGRGMAQGFELPGMEAGGSTNFISIPDEDGSGSNDVAVDKLIRGVCESESGGGGDNVSGHMRAMMNNMCPVYNLSLHDASVEFGGPDGTRMDACYDLVFDSLMENMGTECMYSLSCLKRSGPSYQDVGQGGIASGTDGSEDQATEQLVADVEEPSDTAEAAVETAEAVADDNQIIGPAPDEPGAGGAGVSLIVRIVQEVFFPAVLYNIYSTYKLGVEQIVYREEIMAERISGVNKYKAQTNPKAEPPDNLTINERRGWRAAKMLGLHPDQEHTPDQPLPDSLGGYGTSASMPGMGDCWKYLSTQELKHRELARAGADITPVPHEFGADTNWKNTAFGCTESYYSVSEGDPGDDHLRRDPFNARYVMPSRDDLNIWTKLKICEQVDLIDTSFCEGIRSEGPPLGDDIPRPPGPPTPP